MKKLNILLCVFLWSIISYAQSQGFGDLASLKMSAGKGNAGLLDLEEDKNGNLAVVGFFSENLAIGESSYTCLNPQKVKYFYAKFKSNGDLIWLKEYVENSETSYVAAEKVETDASNNMYVFGVYKGTVKFGSQTLTNQGDNKEFLAKYNSNGVLQWVKGFEEGFYNNERDFVTDEQGNSYLLGFYANVAKINTNGEEIYRKNLPAGFTPGAICLWKDKVILATSIYGDRNIDITQKNKQTIKIPSIKAQEGYFYNTDILIASLEAETGEMVWAKMLRSNQSENVKGIGADAEGNISLVGTCSGQAVFGLESFKGITVSAEEKSYTSVPFVMQLNAQGDLRWFKSLPIEDKSRSESGSYSMSLKVDNQGNTWSTRAHCNKELWWAVYIESFDKNGKSNFYKVLGLDNKKNNGFWKSSCGTANVFVHLSKYNDKKYIFGESKYFRQKSLDFTNALNLSNEMDWSEGTKFFIAQYGDGKANPNTTTNTIKPNTSTNNNKDVVVYSEPKFQGRSQTLNVGRYNLSDLTIGNDVIQSIKIPEGLKVTLYEHADFQGETFTLSQDAASLGNFNKLVSSIVVQKMGNNNTNNNNSNNTNNNSNNTNNTNTNSNNNNSQEISFVGCPTGNENVPAQNEAFEKEVLRLTNIERAKKGLPALVWSPDLARAARYHAADMSKDDYFDHDTHDRVDGEVKETCQTFSRIRKFGSGYAENIAMGATTPEQTVEMWMNSTGHRENIMANHKALGVGFYGGYWVQVFGTK